MSNMNRRELLGYGLGAAGVLAAGPLVDRIAAAPSPAPQTSKPKEDAPSSPVSIQRCESYEPKVVRERLDAAIDQVGGIKSLVAGKTVTIKINVTGGPTKPLGGLPGYRTYHIHPNMLAATCALLHEAGAKRIVVVESQYSAKSPEEVLTDGGWDVAGIKAAGGHTVTFEDTRNRGAFKDYAKLSVPWGGFLYPAFMVNKRYEETDVMVSLAKLKDHLSAGITLSIKNLFGMPPTSLYGADAYNENSLSYRGPVLHNGTKLVPEGVPGDKREQLPQQNWKCRVPRVVADLLGARPIDLAIIDGVETNRGGEGPWAKGVEPLNPKLLIVGRNPVCTDAIGTAVMGYDPQAGHFQWPFPGENHLLLLASAGAGVIDPKRIEVRGLPVEKALFPFNPKHLQLDYPTAMYSGPRAAWANA